MKVKPVKPFKSLDEEAEYWDTHDLSKAVNDPKSSISELLALEPKKEVVMTLRVQKAVKSRIEKLARSIGINSATLSRMWIIEKLTEIEKSGRTALK